MAQDWGDMLNNLAQSRVTQMVQPSVAAAPVAANPASGKIYVEGQPASGTAGFMQKLMDNKMLLIGGIVALAAGGYFLMRKG